MRVETDDDLYRVDAVWLGPPGMWAFPWRARYVTYGVGFLVFLLVFTVARKLLGLPLSFFVLAWSLVLTVAITRWIGSRITHERPLGGVLALWWAELTAPRSRGRHRCSTPNAAHVTVRADRPRPRTRSQRLSRSRRTHA